MTCCCCGSWSFFSASHIFQSDDTIPVNLPDDSPGALPAEHPLNPAPQSSGSVMTTAKLSLAPQPPLSQAGSHKSSATLGKETPHTTSIQEPQRESSAPSHKSSEPQPKPIQSVTFDQPLPPRRSPSHTPDGSLSRSSISEIPRATSISTSAAPDFLPPLRSNTLSPQFSETVDVIVQTKLEGLETETKPLSLQRNVVARENYKLIEETKSFADKHCDINEELQLIQGYCTISCSCESCSSTGSYTPLENRDSLESFEEWEEVEAVTASYERKGHTRLRVTITRELGRVQKRMPLDVPEKDAITMFRIDLDTAMVRMPSGTVKPYIPKDRLEHLTQRNKIDELVQDPSADFRTTIHDIKGRKVLAERIHHDAYLLLLIVVYHRVTFKLVEDMLAHQPTGRIQLPLPQEHPKWLKEDDTQRTDSHEARTLRMAYNICYDGQWAFQAAVFENGENQKFDSNIIVPYLWKTKVDTGAYSTVYKVKIDPSHQKLYELPQDKNPELALKSVKRGSDREDVTNEAFKNELLILKGLQNLDDDHIIKLLGTYYQGEECHFLFPYANCNLDKYMRENDPEGFTPPDSKIYKDFLVWIWGQMEGLAKGLCKIHDNTPEDPKKIRNAASKPLVSPEFLDANVAREMKEIRPAGTGWHHDIKPKNILYFSQDKISQIRNPIPRCGLLQIADFGIGKFHSERSGTGTPSKGTQNFRGTVTYAAPESKVPHQDKDHNDQMGQQPLRLSRPYDVWSFGCLLMEVLVWLTEGSIGRNEFGDERLGPPEEGKPDYDNDAFFYLTSERKPKVRAAVTCRLEKLRKDPRITALPGGSLEQALTLVEKVLEVDPDRRPTAKVVAEHLSSVAESARKEAEGLETIEEVPYRKSPVPSVVATDADEPTPSPPESPPRQARHSGHGSGAHRSVVAGNSSRSQSPQVWGPNKSRTNTATTSKSLESGTSTTAEPSMSLPSKGSSRPATPRNSGAISHL